MEKRHARGRVVIVRYPDDFVMGFQYEADARTMSADLRERLAAFGLTLHEDKTRLIEFGKLSSARRQARGDRRPATFAFLGFTHYCARSRDGRFVVKRRTDRKRLARKLHTVRTEQRRRRHAPLPEQHWWLCSVLRGHYRYYGLPSNWHALDGFYDEVCRGWFRALRRRSQRGLKWDRFNQWLVRFPLPRARIFTRGRLLLDDSDPPREEPSAGKPHARICGGEAEWPSYPAIPALGVELERRLVEQSVLRQSILKTAFSGKLVAQDVDDERGRRTRGGAS